MFKKIALGGLVFCFFAHSKGAQSAELSICLMTEESEECLAEMNITIQEGQTWESIRQNAEHLFGTSFQSVQLPRNKGLRIRGIFLFQGNFMGRGEVKKVRKCDIDTLKYYKRLGVVLKAIEEEMPIKSALKLQ